VEVFEEGSKRDFKAAVQLTTFSTQLTAARAEILFTYSFMIMFNSNVSSVSKSII
jgi:hypothetical protein